MTSPPATTLPDEPSIYPYRALQRVPARGLLVFAPHPDDEVFGCGGLLAAMLDAGVPVQVVLVSDGAQGGDPRVREQESLAAARALAADREAPELDFWRLPDRHVAVDDTLVRRMRDALAQSGADWVLAPSPYEIHPDHRAVAVAATQAFAAQHASWADARLAFYEVGHPLLADLLVDITPVLARKRAAIDCFPSQLAAQDYGQQVLALNRFRSYTLGPQVTHAEAYQVLTPAQLHGGVAGLLQDANDRIARRLGLLSGPEAA